MARRMTEIGVILMAHRPSTGLSIWLSLGLLSHLIGLTIAASAYRPCVAEELTHYLEIIERETAASQVEPAARCAAQLAPSKETVQLLSRRLDRVLDETRRLSPDQSPEYRASVAVALAEVLYALKITEGYDKIARYFAAADWNTRRDQEFFGGIAAYGYHRSEMTETFYLALLQLPASDRLARACAAFNRINNRLVVRDEPRFIRAVLTALARLQQEKSVHAQDSCEKTLLSQLYDDTMRQAFQASLGEQLSAEERRILDRFLAKIASPPDADVVEQLTRAFFAVPWKAESSSWQTRHPEVSCEAFHGYGFAPRADDLWCIACASQTGPLETRIYFYLDAAAKSCTLQKVRFSYPSTSQGVIAALTERLAGHLGPATSRSTVQDVSSACWEEVSLWTWQGRELYVFRNTSQARRGEGPPLVEILARDQELISAMKQEEAEKHLEDIEWGLPQAHTLDRKLVRELRATFSTLSILLAPEPPELEEVHLLLLRLLDSAKTAAPKRRPLLLLAADRLAERLEYQYPPSPQWEQQRQKLAGYGLTYEYDPLGGGWRYTHDLLWRIWSDYGTTAWGEHAFLLLQSQGWDTGVGCAKGSDQFREVIRRGERFLKRRPQSPRRIDVLFAVAQAYETWWSLSQAAERDDYVDRAAYQAGAPGARTKAIKLYERVLCLAPDSLQAAYARRRLPRLKFGLDTNQRRFFCIYD